MILFFHKKICCKAACGQSYFFERTVKKMAATRLIALHINKGKTVAQCLADRTDYSQNAAKTEDGKTQ